MSPRNFSSDLLLSDILDPPYPLETLRELYKAPLGGSSKNLKEEELGISFYAFKRQKIAIPPYVGKVILYVEGKQYFPLGMNFYVVPLKPDERPHDFAKSLRGEIVIPETLFHEMWEKGIRLEPGTTLVLNGIPSYWNERTLKGIEAIFSKMRRAPPKHVIAGYG